MMERERWVTRDAPGYWYLVFDIKPFWNDAINGWDARKGPSKEISSDSAQFILGESLPGGPDSIRRVRITIEPLEPKGE